MARKNLTREGIIEATMALIDEKGSSSNVNFREIARALGCAHTSIYNLFPSYSELLHETAKAIMLKMRTQLMAQSRQLVADGTYENPVIAYIGCVARFALDHHGWYRFLWMDYFDVDLGQIFKDQPRPELLLLDLYLETCRHKITAEEGTIRLSIGHGYLHGELCKYLSARNQVTDEQAFIDHLLKQVRWLLGYNINFM